MIRNVLANFHLSGMTAIGMLLFIAVFVGTLFWVFRKNSKNFYNKISNLPLEDLDSINTKNI